MRRSVLTFAVASTLVFGACSSGEVVVTANLAVEGVEGTEMVPLDDIEVWMIPFDRDEVFDSLAAAAPIPEPEIPADILEAQDSIAAAQDRWQSMDERWSTLRDSLQTLNTAMQDFSPAEPAYRRMFTTFNELQGQVDRLEREKQQAFQRFDSLQKANIEAQQAIALQRDEWATDAFAGVDVVFDARQAEAGREMVVDTTGSPVSISVDGAPGTVRFTGLKPGTWYVHARYDLLFTELYWNVRVEVEGDEPVVVELTRENALERPKI